MKKLLMFTSLLLVFVTACGGKTDKTADLTVGLLPSLEALTLYVAQEEGYFEELGLEVELVKFTGIPGRESAMVAGELDGTSADLLAISLYNEGGIGFKATSISTSIIKVVAGKDSGVTQMSDFTGKKIGLSKNTVIEYIVDAALIDAGMDVTDVEKVDERVMPTRLALLKDGTFAGAGLPEPLAASAVNDGATVITDSNQLGINIACWGFTQDAIDNKNDKIELFYQAYEKAMNYINETDNDTIRTKYAPIVGLNEADLSDANLALFVPATLPVEQQALDVVAWMIEKGNIETSFTYNNLVETKYIK